MIIGTVTPNLEAVIPLTIMDDTGIQRTVDAVIDTGFNGTITLPSDLIHALNLTAVGKGQRMLADGQIAHTSLYVVRILWQNQVRIGVAEDAEGSPLVGMELLLDNILTVDVRNGGTVTVDLTAL